VDELTQDGYQWTLNLLADQIGVMRGLEDDDPRFGPALVRLRSMCMAAAAQSPQTAGEVMYDLATVAVIAGRDRGRPHR